MPDDHAQRAEIPFDEHATGEVRVLDPERVRLFRTAEGVPRAVIEGELGCLRLLVMCSFPLSRPYEYVSLRDGANREIGLIENLRDLDRDSRRIAREEIERRYFLPEITAVHRLDGHFGTYDWEVELPRGTAGLPSVSTAKCAEVYTLSKDHLVELSGMLPREHLERIDHALMVALDLRFAG